MIQQMKLRTLLKVHLNMILILISLLEGSEHLLHKEYSTIILSRAIVHKNHIVIQMNKIQEDS